MSDIELNASIDFRAAEAQVDAFVASATKKMSNIMAAASRAGGSNSPVGSANTATAPGGSYNTSTGSRAAGQTSAAQAYDTMRKYAAQENRDLDARRRIQTAAAGDNARFDNDAYNRMRRNAEYENGNLNQRMAIRQRADAANAKYDNDAFARQQRGAVQENRDIDTRTALRARADADNKKFDNDAYDRQRRAAELINRNYDFAQKRGDKQIADEIRAADAQRVLHARAATDNQKFDDAAMNRIQRRAEYENRDLDTRMAIRARAEAANAKYDADALRRAQQLGQVTNGNSSATAQRNAASQIRTVGTAQNTALGVSNRIDRQLGEDPKLQTQLYGDLDRALRTYTGTVQAHGVRSVETARATVEWNKSLTNIRSSIAEHGGLLKTLNDNASSLRDRVTTLGGSFSGLTRLMMNTAVVLSSLSAAFGFREIVESIINFERFSNTLRSVSGSTAEYQRNLSFLTAEANRIGFSVAEVGNSFARLSVAMQASGVGGDQVRSSFTQLSEAARNFGLSAADTNGVIRALEQSFSKGKFTAEEVRNQLGDRLPIAMQALTAAVRQVDGRVTDINKRFEEGTLDVARYGAEFIRQINIMSGGSETLARTQNTLAAAFGRFSTQFMSFANSLGEGGFTQAVIRMTDSLRNLMVSAQESGAVTRLGEAFAFAARNADVLTAALTALAATAAIRMLVSVGGLLLGMNPWVAGATVAITALAAAYALLDRNTPERAIADFREATASLTRATDAAKAGLDTFNATIARGGQVLDGAANQTETMIQTNMRLGDSYLEAARKAAQAEVIRQQALYATAQAAERAQAIAGQERVNSIPAIASGTAALSAQLGADARATGLVANQGSAQQEWLAARADVLSNIRDAIRQVGAFETTAEEALIRVRAIAGETSEDFRLLFGNDDIYKQVEGIMRALATLAGDQTFTAMRTAAEAARASVASIQTQIEQLRAAASDPVAFEVRVRQTMENTVEGTAETAYATPGGRNAPARTPVDLTQLGPTRKEDNALRLARTRFSAAGLSTRGVNGDFTLPQLQSQLRDMTGMPGAQGSNARELQTEIERMLKGTESGAAGAGRAVQEYMRDLRLATTAAEASTGAETAHAQALKRLQDAAVNGRGAADISRLEAEAEAEVQKRLNTLRDVAIRQMGRETSATNRVAAAYADGTEAGRRAEVVTQAQTRATEFARENNVSYRVAVEMLTVAIQDKQRAEANNIAGRAIATNTNEIEMLRLEGTLITANVGKREEELAVLRARQSAVGASPEMLARLELSTRQTVQLRQQTEQLNNSWSELSKIGEQAFERIGSAITEAFANGKIEALDFKKITKAVFSEVIQAALKLAVVNPLLNSMFGGTRGTAGGIMSGLGSTGSVASAPLSVGGSAIMSQLFGSNSPVASNAGSTAAAMQSGQQSLGLRTVGQYGNLGSAFSGQGLANTGWGVADGFLNAPLVGSGGLNAALGTQTFTGMYNGTATTAPVISGGFGMDGLTTAGALGGAASIGLGGLSIYQGVQKGGVGGAVGVAGGVAGMAGGAATIAGGIGAAAAAAGSTGLLATMGPTLAMLGPWGMVAAAVLAIVSALLPGEKASGKGQEYRYDLGSGQVEKNGLTGNRYSAGNAEQAEAATMQIVNLASELSSKLGNISPTGQVAVGVTSSRGDGSGNLYLELNGEKSQYANNEGGAKDLADTATRLLLKQFRERATGDYKGILEGSGDSIEALSANLDWYDNVYKSFQTGATAANQFDTAMESLNQSFGATAGKAKDLSLATDDINTAWVKAQEKLAADRDAKISAFDIGLDVRSLQVGGTATATTTMEQIALMQFDTQATQQILDVKSSLEGLGMSAEDVATRVARNEQILGAERLAIQKQFADAALAQQAEAAAAGLTLAEASNKEAVQAAAELAQKRDTAAGEGLNVITNLVDYVKSLTTGDAAPGTIMDRFTAANDNFTSTYNKALGGDANSLSGLKDSAETYRGLAREVYGGGQGYADAINLIGDRIGSVASMGEEAITQSFMRENDRENTEKVVAAVDDLTTEVADLKAISANLAATMTLLLNRPAA